MGTKFIPRIISGADPYTFGTRLYNFKYNYKLQYNFMQMKFNFRLQKINFRLDPVTPGILSESLLLGTLFQIVS